MTSSNTARNGTKDEKRTNGSARNGAWAKSGHPESSFGQEEAPERRHKVAGGECPTGSDGAQPRYLLRLYIAGVTSRSATAVANLKSICEEHLKGRYQLDVVDIYQQPTLASRAQITAVPTLIRKLPPPLRRIVGDMSKKERVLIGLDMMDLA